MRGKIDCQTSTRRRVPTSAVTAAVLIALAGVCTAEAAAEGTITLEWTPLDQLESVTTPQGTTSYTYDGDGQRITRSSPSGVVHYVRDAAGNVIQEYDGAGTLLAQYVYAGSRRIAKIDPDGRRFYYHADAVETPLAMTDENGDRTWRGENKPFGEEAGSQGQANRYRFTGNESDGETGLLYFEARYYDPRVGRFISTDPVPGTPMEPQRLNRYAYALNNPFTYVDRDGRAAWYVSRQLGGTAVRSTTNPV